MGNDHFIDVTQDGTHLSVFRGFLLVQKDQREVARIPLDYIHSVIVHAHGVTYTNNLLVKLMDRRIGFVFCGSNHMPSGQLWPVDSHCYQAQRIDWQIKNTERIKSKVWKDLIKSKIFNQGHLLLQLQIRHGAALLEMSKKLKAADPENLEAQAARRYFKALFGNDFIRNRDQAGVNSLLNYGYIILRSIIARQVMNYGLHPVFGVHHKNRHNSMRLVDDFIEPFRPLVDLMVITLIAEGVQSVTPEAKKEFGNLVNMTMVTTEGEKTLKYSIDRMVGSYIASLEVGKNKIYTPYITY